MKDEQMQFLLDAWYRDRDEAPRDANSGLARVMARLPEVRQRGRWWPLPAFHRPVSTFPSQGPGPTPIPLTNGRTRPRGSTMFSAVKFMVAGVIVALFGGFLLTGVLLTQQADEVAPAAVTESPTAQPTDVSAAPPGPDYITAEAEWTMRGVFKGAGLALMLDVRTVADDARLTGEGKASVGGEGNAAIVGGRLHIRNDRGEWFGPLAMANGEDRYGAWLVGAGEYEGLTALLHGTMELPVWEEGGPWVGELSASTIEGWVFSEPVSRPVQMRGFRAIFE